MNRAEMLADMMDSRVLWDLVIIGGGATGMGVAVDAASRGYKVLLAEQHDFGKGTSSRSTKLVHGGVRYLQQGNISLVLEALKERSVLRRNAPHLVKDLSFVVPIYDWWEGPFYGIGLKLYDFMAGKEGFGASRMLSKEETLRLIPTVETDGLRGGVEYHDGQFDDARLLINLAQTACEQGATVINYMQVNSLVKRAGLVAGVELTDQETQEKYHVRSKMVVNATGVFSDAIRRMDQDDAEPIMTSSQGVHVVLDKSFLPGESAIMVPHTDDGRVMFAVPWQDKIIVGTTDTPVQEYLLEPIALQAELDFLMSHAARYLTKDPQPSDVKSVFTGLRPLVKGVGVSNTAAVSREHTISISKAGLLTVAGGKWTTYRKMAEDVLEKVILLGNLAYAPCRTEALQIHGCHLRSEQFGDLMEYGCDAPALERFYDEHLEYRNRLHPAYRYTEGEVVWSVRHEMARTPEDFLARRARLLFLDVQACLDVVARVADIMAAELGKNDRWKEEHVNDFVHLSKKYRLPQTLS